MLSGGTMPYPGRYSSLDMWRGVASFLVVIHHLLSYRHSGVNEYFYLFVQVFFVISGYCLTAALHRSITTGMGFGTFMKRRVKRIAPPYLASVFFALGCISITALRDGGLQRVGAVLTLPWWSYLQNMTMTQWLSITHQWATGQANMLPWANQVLFCPPHWSLNYEEQFYLLMGASIALSAFVRPAVFLAVLTAVVAILNVTLRDAFSGFFFDYWLQFATGLVVYLRLCGLKSPRVVRIFDGVLIAVVLSVSAWAFHRGELKFDSNLRQFWGQLSLCLWFATLLIVLRRFDRVVSQSPATRVLMWLGAMSYSLYLVHYPLLKLLLRDRMRLLSQDHSPWVVEIGATVAVLVVSFLFYRAFERPFLNTSSPRARVAPPAAEVAVAPAPESSP
jgi:peptidoglycan/LPS O-acetylase OafA/YrhL